MKRQKRLSLLYKIQKIIYTFQQNRKDQLIFFFFLKKPTWGEFPGGPVVANLSCNAGDIGSISGQGTKIPHTMEQLVHVPSERS